MPTETTDRDTWLAARKALLAEEKAHTAARDQLAAARRNLPRLRINKNYVFQGPNGAETLPDLFAGRSQLAVYHFMFAPDWEAGCTSCSFWADNLNGTAAHMAQRDVSLVMISSAPLDILDTYRRRMGWDMRWYSAHGSDFNHDMGVSFDAQQLESGDYTYNYRKRSSGGPEAPGLSAFQRDADGSVYLTYATYGRGLDHFNGAYQLLDLMPKGRDEEDLPFTMAWLRRHDEYPVDTSSKGGT